MTDLLWFIGGTVFGAIAAFLIAWYWIRKYGENIENKVRDTYNELADATKQASKYYYEELLRKLKK